MSIERKLFGTNASGDSGWGLRISRSSYVSAEKYAKRVYPTSSGIYFLTAAGLYLVDSDGDAVLKSYITSSSYSSKHRDIDIDSSGNVHLFGYAIINIEDGRIVKLSGDSSISWQKKLYTSGASRGGSTYGGVDSSGNIYGTFNSSNGVSHSQSIFKLNSSGVTQWQRQFVEGTGIYARAMVVDSSGNLYCSSLSKGSPNKHRVFKINSSGSAQWGTSRSGSGSVQSGEGDPIRVYGSYVYALGTEEITTNTEMTVIKRSTSDGAVQWAKRITASSTHFSTGDCGIVVDSDENVYIAITSNSSTRKCCIVKFNSSGTKQWATHLAYSGHRPLPISITIDGDFLYLGGTLEDADDGTSSYGGEFLAKLSVDGNDTGTYGDWTYSTLSLTVATSAATEATPDGPTLTSNSTLTTASTSDLSTGSSSFTETLESFS